MCVHRGDRSPQLFLFHQLQVRSCHIAKIHSVVPRVKPPHHTPHNRQNRDWALHQHCVGNFFDEDSGYDTSSLRVASRKHLSSGWTPKYVCSVTSTGGRTGSCLSSDGNLDVKLTHPKGLGGPELPGTTNPEQLFGAGYSACFIGAMGVHAQKVLGSKLPPTVSVTANVSLLAKDGEGFKIGIKLTAKIPGVVKAETLKLMTEAHKSCPYSKATHGNIDCELDALDG
eukprot:TRINITY_DN4961_c0_g1_i1.p1 TRINITY_DN4961_c0_g1~~TRINITY_DN4961_c0_g1_i1.p1  ORF type:complete len:227 (-),score=38.30 TRINITY_DN4961_c0_g1_i1:115-795(-)